MEALQDITNSLQRTAPDLALVPPNGDGSNTKLTFWTPSQKLPKSREKILVAIVQHIERGRGMTEPDVFTARIDATKLAAGLTRISDDDLFPVFQSAWNQHKNPREPFGVIQVNRAYDEILEQRLAEQRKAEGEQILVELRAGLATPQCRFCNDKGMQPVRHRDGYTSARPCVCPRSKGGARPTRPLCEEDGWTKNHRNEWERTSQ
jgi:hypothetical protein